MKSIYSFDVFDTCIVRRYENPPDLFSDLALQIFRENGAPYGKDEPARLAHCRRKSERMARKKLNGREDVTLQLIYEQLEQICPFKLDFENMLRKEIELEEICAAPVHKVKTIIDELRDRGLEVLFISDMYLPSATIRKILIDNCIAEEGDEIYVSSETGLRKQTGNLYRHVLQSKNISASQLFHLGDNYLSDYSVPKKLGINAEIISIQSSNYLDYQVKGNSDRFNSKIVVSKLRGIHRAAQAGYEYGSKKDVDILPFVHEVVAPLLLSFLTWVMEDAVSKQIKRLYFVSRDGQVLYEIAGRLKSFQNELELRYLYGSRHAWNTASILELDENVMHWILRKNESISVNAILQRMGMEFETLETVLSEYGFARETRHVELDRESLDKFISIIRSEPVLTKILDNSKRLRRSTIEYLQQEGLFDGEKYALVDIGWYLTCQNSLNRILSTEGYSGDLHGYYLGVRRNHQPLQTAGRVHAFIWETHGSEITRRMHPVFFEQGTASVIEEVFTMADHPRVVGYIRHGGVIKPRFADENPVPVKNFLKKIRDQLYKYTEMISDMEILPGQCREYADIALRNADKFFHLPPKEYVELISWIPLNAVQNHVPGDARILARKLSLSHLFRLAAHVLYGKDARFMDNDHGWYAACAAISPFHVRILFVLMRYGMKIIRNNETYESPAQS